MKHTIQLLGGLIHALRNDSISLAGWAGSVMCTNIWHISRIDTANAGLNGICTACVDNGLVIDECLSQYGDSALVGSRLSGFGLQTFTYSLESLFVLGNDYLNLPKQPIIRSKEQPARGLSSRLALEPRTTHRSRERRPLATFSF
ncbi:MAG: hypothetical protein AAGB19_01200 [Cyanobacteria bacterium P01_F01_bin.3]